MKKTILNTGIKHTFAKLVTKEEIDLQLVTKEKIELRFKHLEMLLCLLSGYRYLLSAV